MLLQLIVSGIMQGALYALVALSMTFILRSTTILNFGQGDLLMMSAFILFVLVVVLGVPFWISFAICVIGMFAVGCAIERWFIRPILNADHITQVLMTIVIGFVIHSVSVIIWGHDVVSMSLPFEVPTLMIGPVVITGSSLLVFLLACITTIMFFSFLFGTRAGLEVRALHESRRGAQLVGVNVDKRTLLVWGTGIGIAAVAGAILAPTVQLYPEMGQSLLLKGFAAMAIGGFGSLWGVLVGGVFLGVMENLAGAYINTALLDLTAYLLTIAVLIAKPSGLFGKRELTKL